MGAHVFRVERQRLIEHLNRPRLSPQRLQLTLSLDGRVRLTLSLDGRVRLTLSLDGQLTLILDGRVRVERQRIIEHLNRPRLSSQRLHGVPPREFEFPFPGSLTSSCLEKLPTQQATRAFHEQPFSGSRESPEKVPGRQKAAAMMLFEQRWCLFQAQR